MRRTASVFLLVVSALLAATIWFSAATQPFNVQLERERPAHVYDFFSYYAAATRLRQAEQVSMDGISCALEYKRGFSRE